MEPLRDGGVGNREEGKAGRKHEKRRQGRGKGRRMGWLSSRKSPVYSLGMN